jgi:N-acetylglucosamine kinase-like BadF-type ATPase
MNIVAGIDGGATRTRAALAAEDGKVLGIGIAGPSNYDNVGIETARGNIGSAVRQAWDRAGMAPAPVQAIFLGMAGVVSPEDRETITRMVLDLGIAPRQSCSVDHDIRTALAGGLAGREGLALIAGTGSSCYGRRHDGRNHRVGWGYLLDDLGSSYNLGHRALIAAVWEADRRGPATALSARVQQALGYGHIDEIMRLLYHHDVGVKEIAALAPLVLKTAEAGDAVAQGIITTAASDLAYSAYTVARVLDFAGHPFEMAVVGGLAESGAYYRAHLERAIHLRMPECSIRKPELPPVLGAVVLALESDGAEITPRLIARLKESFPNAVGS